MRVYKLFGGAPLIAAGSAGVLIAHQLAYLIALPRTGVRDALLAHTGHGYLEVATKAVVALVVTGSCTLLSRARRARSGIHRDGIAAYRWSAMRLIVAQIVAYGAMESLERVAAGVPVTEALQHHLFAIGVAVQIMVALAGAALLLVLGRGLVRILTRARTHGAARGRQRRQRWAAVAVPSSRREHPLPASRAPPPVVA